jgi:hypothetical protein
MDGKVRIDAKRVSKTEEVVAMNKAPVTGKMDFCSAVLPVCVCVCVCVWMCV